MFGRWQRRHPTLETPRGTAELAHAVEQHLPEADPETVQVVTAISGLLGAVAYADRDYAESEERRVRRELARVHGMTSAGVDAICAALRRHVLLISTVEVPGYCRTLRELGDRELRAEVLGVLLEVAAADDQITHTETNLLRQLTTSLGLTQDDYNAAQARHREKLAVLGRE
ncbi:MAG: TerB family tellurite resistance protein [Polyangiaceae bacterium]|nr:TerB family tellurite resistance protein [Polyangiaceae bacterium]